MQELNKASLHAKLIPIYDMLPKKGELLNGNQQVFSVPRDLFEIYALISLLDLNYNGKLPLTPETISKITSKTEGYFEYFSALLSNPDYHINEYLSYEEMHYLLTDWNYLPILTENDIAMQSELENIFELSFENDLNSSNTL